MDANRLQDLEHFLDEIQKYNHELEVLALDKDKADATSEFKYKGFEISNQNKIEIDRETAVNQLKKLFESYNLGLLSRYPVSNDNNESKFLAMIDILGFSKIVSNQNENELKSIFDNFVVKSTHFSLAGWNKHRMNADGRVTPDLQLAKINHLILSDTLFFWTNDGSANSLIDLIEVVYHLFFWNTKQFAMPLRGAITYGSLNFNDPIFILPNAKVSQSVLFGKAIIEAHFLEKNQQWLGCMLSMGSIDAFYEKKPTLEQIEKLNKYIINYQVPFKGKGLKFAFIQVLQNLKNFFKKSNKKINSDFWVINWANTMSPQKLEEDIRKCFTHHTKDSNLKGEALIKYKNTIKFANFVVNNPK